MIDWKNDYFTFSCYIINQITIGNLLINKSEKLMMKKVTCMNEFFLNIWSNIFRSKKNLSE